MEVVNQEELKELKKEIVSFVFNYPWAVAQVLAELSLRVKQFAADHLSQFC